MVSASGRAILRRLDLEVWSDDPIENRREIERRIRSQYGSIWLLILSPIIGELVRLLIERWKEKHRGQN